MGIFTVTYIGFYLISSLHGLQSQKQKTFIQNCNAEELVEHQNMWNHSYCAHACGILSDSTVMSKCTEAGVCKCQGALPCDESGLLKETDFGDFCIHDENEDQYAESTVQMRNCKSTCLTLCNGVSIICGENFGSQLSKITRVCVCRCPSIQTNCSTTEIVDINGGMNNTLTDDNHTMTAAMTTTSETPTTALTYLDAADDQFNRNVLVFCKNIILQIIAAYVIWSVFYVIEMYCLGISILIYLCDVVSNVTD